MSETLKVEKQVKHATVCLVGGESIEGSFFLSGQARTHTGPETVVDLLNNRDVLFVPFRIESDQSVVLLQKSRIQWVDVDADWAREVFEQAEEDGRVKVTIHFSDSSCEGELYTGDMPPEKRRAVDVLNGGEVFLLLKQETSVRLVNRLRINRAVPH